MNLNIFDNLIDAVIILDRERRVVYANESAANLCQLSLRRMLKGKPHIFDIISFKDEKLFLNPEGEWGLWEATPLVEDDFVRKANDSTGRAQVLIHPFKQEDSKGRWFVILHDVTLEQNLTDKYRSELDKKEEVIEQLKQAQVELEDYSKNLEKKVADRTEEVRDANEMLSAIMNSLGQGFLTFDSIGACSDIYTKACESILETVPAKKNVKDVLKLDVAEKDQFDKWLKASFEEALPFDSLKELAPQNFTHSEEKHITLDYYPIRSEEQIKNLVLVATDKTVEFETQKELEREKEFASMIIKFVKDKERFIRFLKSAKAQVIQLKSYVESTPHGKINYDQLYRELHTIEGEAGAFSVTPLRDASRKCQESISILKDKEATDDAFGIFKSEIIDLESSLEKFVSDNKELFSNVNLDSNDESLELSKSDVIDFYEKLIEKNVDNKISQNFQDKFLKQPIGNSLKHFNNLIKLVADKQNKEVNDIQVSGGDIRVFPDHYQDLFSALVHIFRNAIDHGLEYPEERQMMGKPDAGQLSIEISKVVQKGDKWLQLIFVDDGQGIDPEVINKKLKEKNLITDDEKLSDHELIQFIFHPGFSTREEVGEFSGRGVGMDALKNEVVRLGGEIRVESEVGVGTKFTILVPEAVKTMELAKGA